MIKTFAIILLAGALVSTPTLAQNRFVDQARDNANRRAENKAVREAEHPEDSKPAAPAAPAAPAQAPAPAAATAAASPAPATPAQN
jgi:hypothetical protein